MRLWSWLARVVQYMNCREPYATMSNGYRCGVPERSPRQANLVRVLNIARFTLPVVMGFLLASSFASAQNGAPAPRPSDEFSFMQLLADKGLHDIENESWNAYGQFTYISSWKPSFSAPYTNLNGSINSLLPTAERSFTGTATLYLGVRLWKGAEGYLVPGTHFGGAVFSAERIGRSHPEFRAAKRRHFGAPDLSFPDFRQADGRTRRQKPGGGVRPLAIGNPLRQ